MGPSALGASAQPGGRDWTRYWTLVCGGLMCAVALCLAADAAFDPHFQVNRADWVAYFDMADALKQGNTGALLNAYWSPGYPVVLAAGLAALRPSSRLELAAIYAIHWVIAIFALACLAYFVTGLPDTDEDRGVFGLSRPMLLSAAVALFFIAVRTDVQVALMTPDLLLGGLLWLAGGAFLRIARRQHIRHYALLAVAISLAYFTKAAALSLAVMALAILPFTGPSRRRAIRGTLLYAILAAVLIAPYVNALSRAKGRFTFGESGAINYAWIVDGADGANRWHMQEDTPHGHAHMRLLHPARRLMKSPDAYEFGSPVAGSMPIFDDPSYWNDGLRPAFYLKGQIWHIGMNLYHTLTWLAARGEFVVALLLLLLAQARFRTPGRLRETVPVLVWFAGFWALYMLVDVEDRYVFALLTAVLVLVSATIRLPDSGRLRAAVAACTLVLVCGAAVRQIGASAVGAYQNVRQQFVGKLQQQPVGDPYWDAATTLTGKLGLRPGDSVACMQLGCENTYWARLAGLRITAELSGETDYWKAVPADRARAMSVLAQAGVKAVVTRHLGPGAETEGWTPLSDSRESTSQALYAKLTR